MVRLLVGWRLLAGSCGGIFISSVLAGNGATGFLCVLLAASQYKKEAVKDRGTKFVPSCDAVTTSRAPALSPTMMLVRAVAAALAVALFSHASALEECAGGDVHTASKQLQNPGRQSVLFNNQHQKTVQLFWVNSAGSEVYMDEIASGMQRSFSTYEGHAWRIKSYAGTPGDASYTIMDVMVPEPLEPAEDGSVSMHEFVVPRCGTASQGSLPVETLPASDLASVLADRFPKCTALDSLGQDAVPGFHVVCSNGATGEVAVARSKTDEFVVFTVPEKVRASPVALRTAIERTLELPDPWIRTFMGRKLSASYHRPFWTLFTTDGLYKMTQWEHMVSYAVTTALPA